MVAVVGEVLLARRVGTRPEEASLSEAPAEVAPGKLETGLRGAVLRCCCGALYHALNGLGRQFEVGRDDGANRRSWWNVFSACAGTRAPSRRAWGGCLSLRVIVVWSTIDWMRALQRFVLADRAACSPSPQHPKTCTNSDSQWATRAPFTTITRSVVARCTTRRRARPRCAVSGSQASPTSAHFTAPSA